MLKHNDGQDSTLLNSFPGFPLLLQGHSHFLQWLQALHDLAGIEDRVLEQAKGEKSNRSAPLEALLAFLGTKKTKPLVNVSLFRKKTSKKLLGQAWPWLKKNSFLRIWSHKSVSHCVQFHETCGFPGTKKNRYVFRVQPGR